MFLENQALKKVSNMGEYTMEIFRKMQDITTENNQMSEEKKQQQLLRIQQKLKNGSKLTAEELSFIQHYYPEMYPRVMRIQAQRKQLENQLKQAKSKEDAARIYNDAMNSIAKEDPDKAALQAAYSKAYAEFKETAQYKSLPEKDKDSKENDIFSTNEDIDEVEKEKRLVMQPKFDVTG